MTNPFRSLPAVILCALVLGACDHTVQSPPVTAGPPGTPGQKGPVDPDLVCVEQLTTALTLTGDGFTPFPSQTLQDTVELLLPRVELTRTRAIDGSAAEGTVEVPDDVKAPGDSHVSWTSEQQMAFEVFPELALPPGLYDVKVTNRDGLHSADFPGAFAAVPRPALTRVAPDILCDAQADQTVTLTGTGLLDVGGKLPSVRFMEKDFPVTRVEGCLEVPGAHAAGTVRSCTTAVFVLPKGSCAPGKAVLTLTNPATAACASTDSVSLTVVPPPTVSAIEPDLVCSAQADQSLVITGTGFLQMGAALPLVKVGDQAYPASALSECTEVPGPFVEGVVKTCTRLQFTLTQGSRPAGEYDVVVTNPPPADCHSVETLKLRVVDPPTLASVTPDLACNAQGAVGLTLRGTGFLKVGTAVPSVQVGAAAYVPSLSDCTPLPGPAAGVEVCTTLQVSVPQGALQSGRHAVMVTNPAPAACHSTEAVSLEIVPAPEITGFAQTAICDDQAAQVVTLQGTGFLQIGVGMPEVTVNSVRYVPTAMVGCTEVTGPFAEGQVQTCTGVTIEIPKGALPPGSYPVTVQNPAPAGCSTTSSVSLVVFPPPTVTAVAPPSICNGGGTLSITGTDFGPAPTVLLRFAGKPDVTAVNVTVNPAGTLVTAQVPSGAEPGFDYEVVVSNGCEDRPLPHKTVRVVPGPKLFFADPEVVYSGINTRVTLYVTALTLPLTSVGMTPKGASSPVIALQANVAANNKVQVVVPTGTPAGEYDLELVDSVKCPARLPAAIRVTDSLTVSVKQVVPPFGWTEANTDVTIFRDTAAAAPANAPFVSVPRVFLNPTNPAATDIAIQLTATSLTNADTLTSVVPKGSPVHQYDLIVVNPDGGVGLLPQAFSVTALPPPVITAVTPSSVVASTGRALTVTGTGFRASTLSFLQCADVTGKLLALIPPVTSGTVACASGTCTQTGTMNASGLPEGASCVLKLTNDDGTWALYSAIGVTGPSLNLSAPRPGRVMNTARRALVAAAGDATQAARFVYAIGGDSGGASPTTLASVESAPVDIFGNVGAWVDQRYGLGTPRAFAAAAQLGRYVYLCGGTDGTGPVATCQRAQILDPLEKPTLDVSDLVVSNDGLDPGYWYYRVAAEFSATDPDNPGGESLPSDEIVVKAPRLLEFRKVQVVLAWSPPVDSKGVPLPSVTGYRVYRTAAVNGAASTEVLLATVPGTTLTYTDNGTATPGTATPLPLGSTGKWASLPAMSVARQGLAMTWAQDPAVATRFYVYSFFGRRSATQGNAGFEYLQVDVQPNGHQTVGAAWKAGTAQTTQARWQIGAFRGDSTLSSFITAPDTYVWIGGGELAAGGAVGKVDVGKVQPGGDITSFLTSQDFSSTSAGYGACAANNQLFVFGGAGAAPSKGARSAELVSPAPSLANNSWNSEGLQMTEARYLLGSAVQSAYIFLLGGQTDTAPATKSTEVVIW